MILLCEYKFSSAHFYHQKKWNDRKNQKVFGACFTEFGHGHNYRMELEFDIKFDNPKTAKSEIDRSLFPIFKSVDHKHLNFDIVEFGKTIPTTENITRYLLDKVESTCPYSPITARLFEMDSLFVQSSL